MSNHHTPYDLSGEDDHDGPWTQWTALSRNQTFHPVGPLTSSPIPAANYTSPINNPAANINREPDTSRHYHGSYPPAPVTVRQQQDGGQPPLQPSLESPITFWDFRHPQGAASTAHPRPHHHHVNGIQQDPLDAQDGEWRAEDPLPPQLRADYALHVQGEMPESHRNQGGSTMLPANMPYSGYRNMYNARQDGGSITHNALGNANDRIRDVHLSTGDSNSQPEPLASPMIPFDDNAIATMNMSNTAPPGVPTDGTHMFAQRPEAFPPTYPDHRPLQQRHPNVIDPQLPASRRAGLPDSARSNVAPQPRRTRRGRSQSSSPARRSCPRKGRKLKRRSHYETERTLYVRRNNLTCDRCKKDRIICTHWDQEAFRSWYNAEYPPNTPTSHATASGTRRDFHRRPQRTSPRALAPSQRLDTPQTSSSSTLMAYPEQPLPLGNTPAHVGEQPYVPARLTSPTSAAAVPQRHLRDQGPQNFDTMSRTASELMPGPFDLRQSPFNASETPSQETDVMYTGMQFGFHNRSEQQLPTSISEFDGLPNPQQYLQPPNYHLTPPSPTTTYPNYEGDPSPLS